MKESNSRWMAGVVVLAIAGLVIVPRTVGADDVTVRSSAAIKAQLTTTAVPVMGREAVRQKQPSETGPSSPQTPVSGHEELQAAGPVRMLTSSMALRSRLGNVVGTALVDGRETPIVRPTNVRRMPLSSLTRSPLAGSALGAGKSLFGEPPRRADGLVLHGASVDGLSAFGGDLRDINDPVLYEIVVPDDPDDPDDGYLFFNVDAFESYEIARPDGPKLHGVTRIESVSGYAEGAALGMGTTVYHLLEAYDVYVPMSEQTDTDPVHGTYLGGLLIELVDVDTNGQAWFEWSVDASTNTFFFGTGNDDTLCVAQRMGLVNGSGVFIPESGADSPAGNRMGVLLAATGRGAFDGVGSHLDFFIEGFNNGAWDPDTARVYQGNDGPLVFTDPTLDEPVPALAMHGVGTTVPDCNNNGIPDVVEITCGTSGLQGTGGCPAGECPYFDDLGTGPLQAEEFANPLDQAGLEVTCIPGNPDLDTNGIIDDCQFDCNSNSLVDLLEIAGGSADDCNGNSTPDVCDIEPICDPETQECAVDCDGNLTIDACERLYKDCNGNDVEDYCDIHFTGDGVDENANGIDDACELHGSTTTMDFEDKGAGPDFDFYNYSLGPVSAQPASAPPDDPNYGNGWWVQEFVEGGQVQTTLTADVTAGALSGGCGGEKYLKFWESPHITVGTPQEPDPIPFGARSPLIQFAEPGTETVLFAYVPGQQSVSLNLEFSHNYYGVDWELDFTQYNENFLNEGSIIVRFVSDTGSGRDIEIVHGGGTYRTHRDWAGAAGSDLDHSLKVTLDYQNFFNSLDLSDAVANVYWDNEAQPLNSNALYPELTVGQQADGLMYNLEMIGLTNSNSNGGPLSNGTLKIDCVEYTRSDGFDAFPDCNDNFLNDFTVDIASGDSPDCNGNRIPDECEYDFCVDCQLNRRLDECDIAGGTSDDDDGNGIPDECEIPIPALVSFESGEGFELGEIRGQNNWFHIGNGGIVNEVPIVPLSPLPTGLLETTHFAGSRILEMLAPSVPDDDPDIGFQFAGMPIYQGEEPAWEQWEFSAALSTVTEELNVNIANLCDQDGGWTAGVIFTTDQLGSTTWRLIHTYQLVNDVITEVPFYVSSTDTSYRRGRPAAVRIEIARHYGNENVRINVMNDDNTTDWVYAHTTETIASGWGGTGGDSQIIFSSEQLLNTKWFDEIKYTSDADCDWDGGSDAAYLVLGTKPVGAVPTDTDGGAGHTADGIPDRCQDCNDNGTLDSYELAGNDCNNNGILDACDIDPDLPFVGWRDDPNLAGQCPSYSPTKSFDPDCFIVREGGGSTDCDENGTPDDCQTTTWGGFSGSPYLQGDCNENETPDECEVAEGTSHVDGDGNGQLDECADCNHNGIDDFLDIGGTSDDSITNETGLYTPDSIPDECCPNDYGADFNHDGKIDLYDFRRLQQCQGQVQRKTEDAPSIGDTFLQLCGCADLNEDGQVNGLDQKIFQLIVTGP